jgi:hypothetical protein
MTRDAVLGVPELKWLHNVEVEAVLQDALN